jgi:DNA-binding IclR family transcriptional regulator
VRDNMPQNKDQSIKRTSKSTRDESSGPRAILRVPEVLIALAAKRDGSSLADLSAQLEVPKTSLHRLLRTLERAGYLSHQAGLYTLGSASFHLASLVGKAAPATAFPACARPVIEWLAEKTHETVLLGVLSDRNTEIVYVDVIDSDASVRFTIPIGDQRPLFSAASGKVVLAFLPRVKQQAYIENTEFIRFTPDTTRKKELPSLMREIQQKAVAFDRNGKVVGASAIASPIFDSDGKVFASVSVAGPTERMEAHRIKIEPLVRKAGERISRVLGYSADYPPAY